MPKMPSCTRSELSSKAHLDQSTANSSNPLRLACEGSLKWNCRVYGRDFSSKATVRKLEDGMREVQFW